jgi:hypothetical protein
MLIGNSQELILLDSYSNLRTGCFDNISFDHKIQKLNDEGYLACSNFEEYKKIKIYEEIGYKGYLKIKV